MQQKYEQDDAMSYEEAFDMDAPAKAQDPMNDDAFAFASKEAGENFDKPAQVPVKELSFKEAFKAARAKNLANGTNDTFTWEGKPGIRFKTDLLSDTKPAPKAAPKPAVKPVMSVTTVKVAPAAVMTEAADDTTMLSAKGGDNLRHFGADGKPKSKVPALEQPVKRAAAPEQVAAAKQKRIEADQKISKDFDNTPINRVFRAVGDAFTKPSSTTKSSSPMRG